MSANNIRSTKRSESLILVLVVSLVSLVAVGCQLKISSRVVALTRPTKQRLMQEKDGFAVVERNEDNNNDEQFQLPRQAPSFLFGGVNDEKMNKNSQRSSKHNDNNKMNKNRHNNKNDNNPKLETINFMKSTNTSKISCIWSEENPNDCLQLLSQRLFGFHDVPNLTIIESLPLSLSSEENNNNNSSSNDSTSNTTTITTTNSSSIPSLFRHNKIRKNRYFRWLFFGDSTTKCIISKSKIAYKLTRGAKNRIENTILRDTQQQPPTATTNTTITSSSSCNSSTTTNSDSLLSKYKCTIPKVERCGLAKLFDIKYRDTNKTWYKPDRTAWEAEGPNYYGYDHPYCTDCAACDAEILLCKLRNGPKMKQQQQQDEEQQKNDLCSSSSSNGIEQQTKQVVLKEEEEKEEMKQPSVITYGGYIPIEFLRDVEIQSLTYNTTQENLVQFIETNYNTKQLKNDFNGKPICVIGSGFHTMALPKITIGKYISNVEWYLDILRPTCRHMIWLSMTKPRHNKQPQQDWIVKPWNNAVKHLLETTTRFRWKSTYIDLYNVSATKNYHQPKDNLHLKDIFYQNLSKLFLTLMN